MHPTWALAYLWKAVALKGSKQTVRACVFAAAAFHFLPQLKQKKDARCAFMEVPAATFLPAQQSVANGCMSCLDQVWADAH